MAPAWSVQYDLWQGGHYANEERALWTGQVWQNATLSGRAGNQSKVFSNQKQAAIGCARCARCIVHVVHPVLSNGKGMRERQELVWTTLFQDHTRWWRNRHQKKHSGLSNFRFKVSGVAACPDTCYKPPWVDVQLGTQADHGAPAAILSLDNADKLIGPGFEKRFTPESVRELCQQGQVKGAVEVLEVFVRSNSHIDKHLLYSVLKECVVQKNLMLGGRVHALAVKMGFGSDTFLCNHFIRMYAGHGKLQAAMDVFRGVTLPNTYMWFSVITAHVKQGQAQRAIELYQQMRALRMKPNGHVLVAALQACAAAGDLQSGKQVHDDVFSSGMEHDKFVCSCLVDMFAKCGSLKDARRAFDGFRDKDVVAWTAMIAGYAKVKGMGQEALALYSAMHNEGMTISDAVTFVCLLQACANVGVSALEMGKQLHSQLKERRLERDVAVGSSLVNMYAKCGSLGDARIVFDGLREKNVVIWTAMIAGYAKVEGMGEEALRLYKAMHNEGIAIPNAVTFVCLLQACANVGASALEKGKQLHSRLKERKLELDMAVGGSLVNMYAKCGSLTEARIVFDGLREKDVVAWTAMIGGYAKAEGTGQEALNLYSAMNSEGIAIPDAVTFVCLLQTCANMGVPALEMGRQLHSQLKNRKLESDVVVGGSLVNMYAKCGRLKEAWIVFDGLVERDVVTWNAMIAGFAKVEGMGQKALDLYRAMHDEGMVTANVVTFVCLLQACANVGVSALLHGRQLHLHVKEQRLESHVVVGGSLVNMYAKCGSLMDARLVFDGLVQKNVVTWNAMIAAYAQQEGMGQQALGIYYDMHNEGMAIPDAVTFVCLLQACANVGVSALETGKQLHSQIKERRLESDVVVGGSLVNMYSKCGRLTDARCVFDRLGEKNVVTWNAMIAGYAQQEGMGQEALNVYNTMHIKDPTIANAVTFVCLLQACASLGVAAIETGKQLHSRIKERTFESDMVVGGSLVNMYAKCGSLTDARNVFDGVGEKDVVTWNAMIAGYAHQESMAQEALNLYNAMKNEGMAAPNAVTFVCLLQACANVGVSALHHGKQLHSRLREQRLESDVVVGGSLVNMYAKCGSLTDARIVFDQLVEKNVVTWNAMISGYAQQEGMGQEALNIFCVMRKAGIATADAVTYVCLLQACASVGALQQGKQLHSDIREGGLESNVVIGTCLVKMYAKCGRLEFARDLFDKLPTKSIETWTALLKGYAEHGEGGMAIQFFEELLKQGILPDEATYICLLTACSHAGLVDQGQQYFEAMVERHGVEPNERHFTCMVDLLGRSGHLDRAEQMLRVSGLGGNAVSWTALLSACKSYGDAELGMRCFDHLVSLQPTVATAYVLLGSIYANAGIWNEVARVESVRKAAGAGKMPAKACIEVKEKVHKFTVGEETSDVAASLRKVNTRVKESGHVPQTQLVLRLVSEQEKEDALCGHAEKLALAYGLLYTPAGFPLLVTKNLRMCNDCHSSTKIMSRLEKREIVVRDGHKVHRFRSGACSCQDRP